MRIKRVYENKNIISVDDILHYAKLKKIITENANKYFELHKHELDEEDFNVDDMKVNHVYFNINKVIIEVRDKYADISEDFELSIEDFVRFCNDPDTYMAAKKYNL